MSRVVKVSSGDYRVQLTSGGNIYYDVSGGGQVIINGNLDVKGTTTTIESTVVNLALNLFGLNGGISPTANGIPSATYYQSGISIARGALNTAEFLFDDSVNHYDPTTTLTCSSGTGSGSVVTLTFTAQSSIPFAAGTSIVVEGFTPTGYNGTYTVLASPAPSVTTVSFSNTTQTSISTYGTITANVKGTFIARTANLTGATPTQASLNGIQLRTLTSDGLNNLVIDMQRGTPTLRLANSVASSGSVPYYQRVLNKDDIPNVEWVQTYIASNYVLGSTTPGTATVQTIQQPVGIAIGSANSAVQATSTGLLFQVGGVTVTTITSAGVQLGNLLVGASASPNEINNSTANNLVLSSNANNIEVTSVLNLDNQIATVTATAASANGTTATITFTAQNVKPFGVGSSITVAGFSAQTGFNGTFTVTGCTLTTVSYALAQTLTGTVFGTVTQSIAYVANKTKLYSSATVGPGKTGIYFANTNGSQIPDELISRNRAVLLSILL